MSITDRTINFIKAATGNNKGNGSVLSSGTGAGATGASLIGGKDNSNRLRDGSSATSKSSLKNNNSNMSNHTKNSSGYSNASSGNISHRRSSLHNKIWLEIEWRDGDDILWRETFARHGGHLRSRTIQSGIGVADSLVDS
eukprot:UN24180